MAQESTMGELERGANNTGPSREPLAAKIPTQWKYSNQITPSKTPPSKTSSSKTKKLSHDSKKSTVSRKRKTVDLNIDPQLLAESLPQNGTDIGQTFAHKNDELASEGDKSVLKGIRNDESA